MRTRRIGTVTLGCILVLFGGLFLTSLIFPGLTYEIIFRLWPVIFIILGLEVLYGSQRYEVFQYDTGAIFLVIAMTFFAMCLAGADIAFRYAGMHSFAL